MHGQNRGALTVFLGYAAGVGKTYAMLNAAHQRKAAGDDVVIGYFEPHGRGETVTKTEEFEIIPRRKVPYHGSVFDEMDTDAILARRPQVCLVDELAHTDVPGSQRAKRWEDVEVLLNNGIDVMTTMNIQHLESLKEQVWQKCGIRVHEVVPDRLLREAHDVVIVDLPPQELLHRLREGAVCEPGEAERARHHFFREKTLTALRELALQQSAHLPVRYIAPWSVSRAH